MNCDRPWHFSTHRAFLHHIFNEIWEFIKCQEMFSSYSYIFLENWVDLMFSLYNDRLSAYFEGISLGYDIDTFRQFNTFCILCLNSVKNVDVLVFKHKQQDLTLSDEFYLISLFLIKQPWRYLWWINVNVKSKKK